MEGQLFSFSSDKDRRTDSRIRRKKHSAAPPGIEPRILRNLVARSNHWATKPQQELRVNFRLSEKREELIRNDPDKSEFTINPLRANYCHTWHMENHPCLCFVLYLTPCTYFVWQPTHFLEADKICELLTPRPWT